MLAVALVPAGIATPAVQATGGPRTPDGAVGGAATVETIDLDAASAIDPATGERIQVLTGAKLYHVVFFATWCPPCVDEIPRLADLYERWEEDGYALVLVAVSNRQTRERVLEFVRQGRVPGRVVIDGGDVLRTLLGVERVPAHLLIDDRGRVLLRTAAFDGQLADRIGDEIRRSR